jgi:hypothetical protein
MNQTQSCHVCAIPSNSYHRQIDNNITVLGSACSAPVHLDIRVRMQPKAQLLVNIQSTTSVDTCTLKHAS